VSSEKLFKPTSLKKVERYLGNNSLKIDSKHHISMSERSSSNHISLKKVDYIETYDTNEDDLLPAIISHNPKLFLKEELTASRFKLSDGSSQ
jgi:hypothetical protein